MNNSNVSSQEVVQIIEKASREPGVNDMLARLRLSQEFNEIEQVNRSLMVVQPVVAQASSTAGWVL